MISVVLYITIAMIRILSNYNTDQVLIYIVYERFILAYLIITKMHF